MNQQKQSPVAGKKQYEPPAVVSLGSVDQLTQTIITDGHHSDPVILT